METSNAQKNTTKHDIIETTPEDQQSHTPLLEDHQQSNPEKPKKTRAKKAIRRSFKLTAHLANLLPTGTVLAFQILSPAFTHEGKCHSFLSKFKTICLIGLCGVSCLVLGLTDSFRDERGKVRYGIATRNGLWVIDGYPSVMISDQDSEKYKLKWVDVFHCFLSLVVFGAFVLFDQNVVKCLFPKPSDEAKEYLNTLPFVAGVISSLLFIKFPTNRHGIGYPLSKQ